MSKKALAGVSGSSFDFVDGDTIPKVLGTFDFGIPLPWRHSSIWVRNAAGAAFGEPADEFANFFFGGFGNNYVDRGAVKRYREWYAMPGFELNAVPGRNFHRGDGRMEPCHRWRVRTRWQRKFLPVMGAARRCSRAG